MQTMDSRDRALEFLRVAHLFRLGGLPTEQPHPHTRRLSEWARRDLPKAVAALKRVDLDALRWLESYAARIDGLARRIDATLERGRRVFLCGCGATGRLSLSLESLWRRRAGASDEVTAFMAGGDVALVHALERFEDHPDYGARHLEQLGFADGDLLVACTEGGETPYVLGATRRAAELSSNPPCLLYCNGDAVLSREVERFRQVYEDPRIQKLCLHVGPMALAGSTRMQASTVLQLGVGLALLHPERPARVAISEYRRFVAACDFSFLPTFIENESAAYESGDGVIYRVRDFGITVFTDTTERAPTFSLASFERAHERREHPSPCYVALDAASTAEAAWGELLNRAPRALEWPEIDPRSTAGYLNEFDFSASSADARRRRIPDRTHHEFLVHRAGDTIELSFFGSTHRLGIEEQPELLAHLTLKQLLNIHSTLVMGRLGRYQSNLMTWVTPTNGKLVDRAARYVGHLLSHAGRRKPDYEHIVHELFAQMSSAPPGESLVLRTYRALLETDTEQS